MLTPAFSFNLNNPVQEGRAVIARLDGINPSLVCVTVGGRVFIYSPRSALTGEGGAHFLSLNKEISCLATGRFDTSNSESAAGQKTRELLLLSSQNTLLAYDVEQNAELFYKEIADGVSALAFGSLSGFAPTQLLVFAGGNCSLQGFGSSGEEVYWNVTSDSVSALCLADVDGDSANEIIVASEDNYLRIFKNEEIIFEVVEAAPCRCLARMSKARFAFGLENGMVGVYHKKSRKWRAKSQQRPIAILQGAFEKEEGYRPLIVARANGQLEIRHDQSGETLHKLTLTEPIAALLRDDFRGDGTQQIIAVTTQGTVRGFTLSATRETLTEQSSTQQKLEIQEQIDQLTRKKQNLLMKYQSLTSSSPSAAAAQSNNNEQQPAGANNQQSLLLPKDTKLGHQFLHNTKKKIVELIISSSKNTFVKGAILFAEKLFADGGEAHFHCPKKSTNILAIPLNLRLNSEERLRAKVLLGTSAIAQYYQVFDFETILPRFASFLWIEDLKRLNLAPPQSRLLLKINERIPRYAKWLEQSFLIDAKTRQDFDQLQEKSDKIFSFEAKFVHIALNTPLIITVNSQEGLVTIQTDDIELCGDLVQDLAHYMNINELDSQGEFPLEMREFKKVLERVEQFKSSRMNITAEIADSVNNVKTSLVKAEDSRILGDMKWMRKYYSDVLTENKNLMTELLKRDQNNEILTQGLRTINAMINKAANLRVGSHKAKVTNLCREAIKKNHLHQLTVIIENAREF